MDSPLGVFPFMHIELPSPKYDERLIQAKKDKVVSEVQYYANKIKFSIIYIHEIAILLCLAVVFPARNTYTYLRLFHGLP